CETHRLPVVGTDQSVPVAILEGCDGGFRLEDGIDTTNFSPKQRLALGFRRLWGVYVQWCRFNLPRCATSVEISKRRWFCMSRTASPRTGSSLLPTPGVMVGGLCKRWRVKGDDVKKG